MVRIVIIDQTIEHDQQRGKEYVAYHIKCQEGNVEWTIQRRYREFLALHQQLMSKSSLNKVCVYIY